MQRPDPEICAACGATWPDQRDDREPEKTNTPNLMYVCTDAGEADPPNKRSPEEDVAQDHENTWDALRGPWATSDPMLALDLAVKQILHDVINHARRAGGLRLTERHTNSVRAMSSTGEDGRGTKRLDAGSSEDAPSRTPRLHPAHVVRSRTIRDVELIAAMISRRADVLDAAAAMSHTARIRPDLDVASHNDQDLEKHPPHTTTTVQHDDSDIEECEDVFEAVKVPLVLASQTLDLTTNVAQETWLASNNGLSALCTEQPEGPLAPAGTTTPTSLSPPQSRRSSIAGGEEVYMPPALLSDSRSRSDNAATGSKDADFSTDSVSESLRHSPVTAVGTTEPDDSYDSDYHYRWPSRSSPILFGDEGFDEWY
ncbi:hypothetical protein VTO73DRAFT_4581 [Trametes versicolor]